MLADHRSGLRRREPQCVGFEIQVIRPNLNLLIGLVVGDIIIGSVYEVFGEYCSYRTELSDCEGAGGEDN